MRNHKAKLLLAFSAGFFLSFVLYVYEAFGIQQGLSFSGHSLLTRSAFFGLGVIGIYLINEFGFARIVMLSSGRKQLLWIAWEIWTASLITFLLFNYFWSFTELSWRSYFLLLGEISAVLLVPHVLLFLFVKKTPPDRSSLITIKSENGRDQLHVKVEDILFIKAEDNYISILFSQGGKKRSKLLRQTLSQVEKYLENNSSFIRIHRSYLVNVGAINSIDKSARKTEVSVGDQDVLPVSKKYLPYLEQVHPIN